jgi:hypothetical protein
MEVVSVATRLSSDDQPDRLRSFPDISKDDLIRVLHADWR